MKRKNIFTFVSCVAQDGAATERRGGAMAIQAGMRLYMVAVRQAWDGGLASSAWFESVEVGVGNDVPDVPQECWRCIDVSTLWGWRHDV